MKLLAKYFQCIKEDMNAKEIGEMSKAVYKKKFNDLIKNQCSSLNESEANSFKIRCSELIKTRNSKLLNKCQV